MRKFSSVALGLWKQILEKKSYFKYLFRNLSNFYNGAMEVFAKIANS